MTDDTLTLPHRLIDEDGELLCTDCQGCFSEAYGVLGPGDETGECGERWKAEYTARCRERDEARDEVGRLQSALGGEITARLTAEAERDEARAALSDGLKTTAEVLGAMQIRNESLERQLREMRHAWHDADLMRASMP